MLAARCQSKIKWLRSDMKKILLISAALSALSFCAQATAESVQLQASSSLSVSVAPAAAQVSKTTAVALRAVALRDRPKLDSTGDVVVPADKRVRLEKSTQNADGAWWYATADGLGGGWVQESELSSPQQQ